MSRSRLEKLAPLTGIVWFALVILGAVLVGGSFEYLPPADTIVGFLSGNSVRVLGGAYAGIVSTFFMLWFAGSLKSALRTHEGGDGRVSSIAAGGAVAAAVVTAAGFGIITAAAARAGASGGIGSDAAVALNDLWGALLGNVLPVALAVLVEATAVVSIRHGAFPAWFGWLSTILTLGLISPFGYITGGIGALWVAVVSVWLYARGVPSESS